jgi:UDP-glucose 6-dehydrogenase
MDKKIGFIGQGWIGKNYSDDFESRGISVVRYSLEPEYIGNKDLIKECDIVFIAVPTPTHGEDFDDSIVRSGLSLIRDGALAVIKSTLLPGYTKKIQGDFPNIFIIVNPEFLSVATAKHDATNPTRNIIGIPVMNDEYSKRALEVMGILPKAPFELVCDSTEAELIKYARNCVGYARVLMANIFYDLSQSLGVDYTNIKDAISADPDNGPTYANAIHKSGRGAGGECFIKDFAALKSFYTQNTNDHLGAEMLTSMEKKNIELLKNTNKDIGLLKGVYGENI